MVLDAQQCVQQGLIGALGSIPGTVCAHPLDLTKIRMQVMARQMSLGDAVRHTAQAPFRGLSAGLQQKVWTRGPMFLCSEIATQSCQKYTGLPRETAVILGSFASGYVTGFLASLSEWAKVQRGMMMIPSTAAQPSAPTTVRVWTLVHAARQEPQLWRSLGRRMRGAAWRNAIFDGTFFGVEHALRERHQQPWSVRMAVAAAVALCLDYPLDVAVKRSFAIPAAEPVPHSPWRATFLAVRREGFQIYRGLTVKVLEFGVSYSVTGAMAPFIVKAFLAATAAMALSTK